MSTTISIDGANEYFAAENHVNAPLWEKFDDTQRTASITHATRLVSRAIGFEVTDDSSDSTASYYPAYAVYEQALFILLNSHAIANGEETAPHYFGDDGTGQPRQQGKIGGLCPEALAWIDVQQGPTVRIARG